MCPRILHIYGPLWINGYGLMIAMGFIVFAYLAYRHVVRENIVSTDDYLTIIFIGFLSAVIGGRLLYVLFEWPDSAEAWKAVFLPWEGGFSLFGSIISVIVVLSLYLRKRAVSVLSFFDIIALYAPLLQTFARLGCFLSGCCYGLPAPAHACFSVVFSDPHSIAPVGIALYPTQLYASAASFLIFIFLNLISRKTLRIAGVTIFLYLLLESFSRFVVDFWRGDREMVRAVSFGFGSVNLSSMQLVVAGVFLFALGGVCFVIVRSKRSRS